MAARHAAGWAVTGIAAVMVAGCATAVAGDPRAVTTPAGPLTQRSSTAPPTPTTSPVLPTSPTGTVTADPTTTPITTASSSGIRPMPPLNSTSDTSGAPTTTRTSGASTGSSGPNTVAGVDLDAVLSDLSGAYVAGVDSTVDLDALASLANGARSQGLLLWVVSIGRSITDDDTSDIADALFDTTGGTLLVLSPSLVSARSDQLTDQQRDAAIHAAAADTNDRQAVSDFIDSALSSTGVATSSGKPTTSKDTASKKAGKVGGIDVDAVVRALGTDHIAVSKSVTEVTAKQLSTTVNKAWNAGLELYVAVVSKDPTGHLYDVATAVMDQTGGTVLMVSPSLYALSSTTLSDSEMNDALDAGDGIASYPGLIKAVVNSLLG